MSLADSDRLASTRRLVSHGGVGRQIGSCHEGQRIKTTVDHSVLGLADTSEIHERSANRPSDAVY